MNFKIIPARAVCIRCSHSQPLNGDHCTGCGASFIFGKQDAWQSQTYTTPVQDSGLEFIRDMMEKQRADKLSTMRCMWDGVKPGTPMGMVCPCPKCSPYSMTIGGYSQQVEQHNMYEDLTNSIPQPQEPLEVGSPEWSEMFEEVIARFPPGASLQSQMVQDQTEK